MQFDRYDIRRYTTPQTWEDVGSLHVFGKMILSYKSGREFLESFSNLFPYEEDLQTLRRLYEEGKGKIRIMYKRNSPKSKLMKTFTFGNTDCKIFFVRETKDEMRVVSTEDKNLDITICEIDTKIQTDFD